MSMTKIAGSGSFSQRHGSGPKCHGSTPKCHGSATLPLTLPASLDPGGRGAEGAPATEEEPGVGGQACYLYRFIIFMYYCLLLFSYSRHKKHHVTKLEDGMVISSHEKCAKN
jgi:hypothetical protein